MFRDRGFDFETFIAELRRGNTRIASAMVNSENRKAKDDDDYEIIDKYCAYSKHDNVEDLLRIIQAGCKIGDESAIFAAENGFFKILRLLLSLYPYGAAFVTFPSLNSNVECMKLLVDTGFSIDDVSMSRDWYPEKAKYYIQHRNSVRSCAIQVLFALRRVKDVSRIIARSVWSSRFQTFDSLQ